MGTTRQPSRPRGRPVRARHLYPRRSACGTAAARAVATVFLVACALSQQTPLTAAAAPAACVPKPCARCRPHKPPVADIQLTPNNEYSNALAFTALVTILHETAVRSLSLDDLVLAPAGAMRPASDLRLGEKTQGAAGGVIGDNVLHVPLVNTPRREGWHSVTMPANSVVDAACNGNDEATASFIFDRTPPVMNIASVTTAGLVDTFTFNITDTWSPIQDFTLSQLLLVVRVVPMGPSGLTPNFVMPPASTANPAARAECKDDHQAVINFAKEQHGRDVGGCMFPGICDSPLLATRPVHPCARTCGVCSDPAEAAAGNDNRAVGGAKIAGNSACRTTLKSDEAMDMSGKRVRHAVECTVEITHPATGLVPYAS